MLLIYLITLTFGCLHFVAGACPNGSIHRDGAGVNISGEIVECKHLQRQLPNDTYGVYRNRVQICKHTTTECCKTCEDILTCQDRRLYLAESYHDCKYLRRWYREDKHIGIYKNRHRLCRMSYVHCCESCQLVANETTGTTAMSTSPTRRIPVKHRSTAPPRVYEDTCTRDCLWIADGTYGSCHWLTNSSNGVYNTRLNICRQGLAPGCKRTCHNIIMESKIHRQTANMSTPGCVDKHLLVDKHSLDCKALRNPSSHVYSRRKRLCNSRHTLCCQTCRIVSQEHSYEVGNPNGFTSVDSSSSKGKTKTRIGSKADSTINAEKTLQQFVHIYSMIAKKAQTIEKEKHTRRQRWNNMINRMFRSMFKQLNVFKRGDHK